MHAEDGGVEAAGYGAELPHKLAECLWWLFVIADRTDIDLPHAYAATMERIGAGLERAVQSSDS